VAERQKRQEDLVLVDADGALDQRAGAAHVGEDVAVREHHPLGPPARARGVDEAGDVVGFGRDAGQRRLALAIPERQGVRPVQHCDRQTLGAVERVDEHGEAHVRRLLQGRQQLLGQPTARADDRARAGMGQEVGVVLGRVGRVRRHGDAARRHDRHVGDQPLGSVLRHDDDALARRDAHGG
jgi:hypothetical protein